MIYLFAGKRRHSDIGSILQRSADSGKIKLSFLEFDIERSPDHDLSSEHLWTQIHDLLKEGYILIVSPPCNTFSRARFQWQRHPGPRPLRNVNWPKGFPWLSAKNKSIVEEANGFILRCVEACIQCHSFGGKFLWEHPEDLGSVNGEFPASIWQLVRSEGGKTTGKTATTHQLPRMSTTHGLPRMLYPSLFPRMMSQRMMQLPNLFLRMVM